MKILQLTPNLMVKDVALSTTFYATLFEMEIQYMIREHGENATEFDTKVETGITYQYAGLIKDGFRIGLQETDSILNDVKEISLKTPGKFSGNLYLEVEYLEKIKSHLEKVNFRELTTTWYGMKEIYFTDPDGYVICVAQKDANFEM